MSLKAENFLDVTDAYSVEQFNQFLNETGTGLALAPEHYGRLGEMVMQSDAGRFAKWISSNIKGVNVTIRPSEKSIALHSNEIWLPLVFLASDTSLSVYLNIVSSFIYDQMKGALKGDKAKVHVNAIYQDEKSGVLKKFTYEGDSDGLYAVLKKINLNKVFDE